MNRTIVFVLVLVAVLLAVLRIAGVTHIAFQAAAHLYVGGLLGAWLTSRQGLLMILTVVLSMVEVMVAIVTRVL